MTKTPPETSLPKRRVRSKAQLDQKRLVDKTKHKENRHENKQRLADIERSITSIQSTLESLTAQLQNLPLALAASAAPAGHLPTSEQSQALLSVPRQDSGGVPNLLAASLNNPWSGQVHAAPQASAGIVTQIWGYVPSQAQLPRILDCRCGSQHPDHFDCVEACNITVLYRSHVGAVSGPSSPFPKDPSLMSMMLYQTDENMLTFLITGFLRQCKTKSIEQLLGFYLLGYRYMRWQMHPETNAIQDIPWWMLPTETQKMYPHSIVVDFLPWPKLRDYLCTSSDADPRHSIFFYFDSMQLRWPPERPLFAQSVTGQVILSPQFESVVFDLENWALAPPWTDAFPHLAHLVSG